MNARRSEISVTVAQCAVETLERLGVEIVFGLPGVHNLPLWRAFADSEVRVVGVRHEQAAVYAADGYARASGRLGVAAVTTGPGAANTLGAVGEAMASGSPVLIIATDIPRALRREGVVRGSLHESRDQGALFRPLTKDSRQLASGAGVAADLVTAAEMAMCAPRGPVYLGVPTDLLAERVVPAPASPSVQSETSLDGDFDRAWQLIANSTRSLIWAGGGALHAQAGSAICELAVRMCAPIVTTYSARGLVDPKHPCFVPGPIHEPEVGRLWDEADLVVAVGTDFDGMSTQNWSMPPPTHLLAANVDAEDASKNYEPDVTLIGDAADIVRALLTRVSVRPGLDELRSDLARVDRAVRHATELDDPEAARFLRAMETVLPRESVLVADMCIPGYWLAGYRRVPLPRTFAYPMGWGTLGFAFPAALGAALATTAPTVCVCGDGGFLFACGELATMAQEMIPVTVIVVDDGGYGMLRFDQRQAGDPPFGVDLARPDFVALARSFGIEATRITGFGESFRDALRHCIAEPGASVLVVDAHLKPPRTTSPRWYRRAAEAEDREES